ncbi:MAG TPA: hypothetical protein VGO48_05575 [Conexibacter sp.]|jgi:hypothetical protein|nr:hypothetical protein [Conexibacter sp.]
MGAIGRTSARDDATAGRATTHVPVAEATRALAAGEIAWLVALPCAALTVLLIAALGPLVGDLLLPSSSLAFFEAALVQLHPEPHEQGRVLVALSGPLLLAGTTALVARRPPRLSARVAGVLVWAAQAAVFVAAIAFLVVQRRIVYGETYQTAEPFSQRYFSNATLVVAVLGALAIVAATRSDRVRAMAARWARETSARRIGWTFAAALLTAVWLLHAFNSEATVITENLPAQYHLRFTLDETFAVLNGRTPLVNFDAQYGSLWPYPVAAAMWLLGVSVGTFTGLMCVIAGLSLLAMYDVLRRVSRSSLTGLVLFAPFLATSFFLLRGPLENRYTLATIFADYPLRFAGPWLLAWLTVRHLDRERRDPHPWPLFLVAGLVAMNNTDHGIPALGALVAALVWTGPLTWRRLRTVALQALVGLAAAFALVSLLTLVRAGALPDPTSLFRFARLYASAGFAMLPMPTLGLHTIIYMTFAAALAAATVRTLNGDADRSLTGALAFIAVFGLGSGTYYAGRSHPEVLVTSFAAWSFALALLTLIAVRRLAAHPQRWPEPAVVLCLVAFCTIACSLAQTPTPWSQVDRLRATGEPVLRRPAGQAFVAANARPGEHVAILLTLGHRIAENLGITNVSPYTTAFAMPAVTQLDDVVRALRAEGGNKVFLPTTPGAMNDVRPALEANGFARVAADDEGDELWIDGAPPAGGDAP